MEWTSSSTMRLCGPYGAVASGRGRKELDAWRSVNNTELLHLLPVLCSVGPSAVIYSGDGRLCGVSLYLMLINQIYDSQTLHKAGQRLGWTSNIFVFSLYTSNVVPSVLWRCSFGGRKSIRPVKNWVMGCWRGYLSGARCRLAYGPADATATGTSSRGYTHTHV